MKELNLLSQEDKKTLVLEKIRILVMLYGCILVLGIVAASVGLFAIRFYAEGIVASLARDVRERRFDPALSQFFSARGRIQEANQTIADVLRVSGKERRIADYVRVLEERLSSDIKLLNLTIGQDGEVSMNGIAPTRDSFLGLIQSLEESDLITDVQSPLENILQREQIQFSIRFTFR